MREQEREEKREFFQSLVHFQMTSMARTEPSEGNTLDSIQVSYIDVGVQVLIPSSDAFSGAFRGAGL